MITKILSQLQQRSGSITAFIIRISGAVITMLMTYLLFRKVGDEQAGLFLLAYTTVMMAAIVCGCGVDLIVLRRTAAAAATEHWGEANSVFFKSLLLVGFFSTAVSTVLWFSAESLADFVFQKPEFAASLRMISPAIAGFAVIVVISRSLQGWRKINQSVFIFNVLAGIIVCAALLCGNATKSEHVSLYYSASTWLTTAVGLLMWRLAAKRGPGTTPWATILSSAGAVWVMVVVEAITKLIGQFFAGRFCSPEEVAQLALSQRVAVSSTIALVAATQHAAPLIAEAWKKNDIPMIRTTLRSTTITGLLLSAPMLLPMLLTPQLVLMIFSDTVSEGGYLLQISAVGQLAMIVCGAGGFVLTMSGRESDMRNAALISGIVAVVSGWLLTRWFGATGAAVSSSLSLIVLNLVSSHRVLRHFGFHPILLILNRELPENPEAAV